MVSRIELLLGAAILFFATKNVYTVIVDKSESTFLPQKLMTLYHAQLYEVNQTSIENTITTDEMVQYAQKTVFKSLILKTPKLTIKASKALLQGELITLDAHAEVTKIDGSQFHTTSVLYDKQSKRLKLTEPFALHDRYGNVNGSRMEYDEGNGSLKAKKIQANYKIK